MEGSPMEWIHKGLHFEIRLERLGLFYLASARAPRVGSFVRIRPFSALGRSDHEAIDLLKVQIEDEFREIPAMEELDRNAE